MALKKYGVATEIITLAEARTHLRLVAFGAPLAHPDDTYISHLIIAAREWCEQYCTRAIGVQTYDLVIDSFPDAIELLSPVQSVSYLKYQDVSNVEQTLLSNLYATDLYSEPSFVLPAYGSEFPETAVVANAVKVRFVSGYTDATDATNKCPSAIKAAMLLIIGNLYSNRQEDQLANTRLSLNSLPMGVYALLQPYRLGISL